MILSNQEATALRMTPQGEIMKNLFFAFACISLFTACSHPSMGNPVISTQAFSTNPVPTSIHDPTPEPTSEPQPYPYYESLSTSVVPYPPPGPSPTPTATPTRRPYYTRTPVPSFTPKPRPAVTILPASLEHFPKLAYDLGYQLRNQLMRLNHKTGQVEIVTDMTPWVAEMPGPNLFYRGQKIILANGFTEGAPYGIQTWQVIHMDTNQFEVMRQFDTGPGKESIGCTSVSPDGDWFTYCQADENLDGITSGYELFLVSTDNPFTGRSLGILADSGEMHWSPDSRRLAWWTREGIWTASPDSPPKLILPKDPQAAQFLFDLINPEWSSTGNYVMIHHAGTVEGGSKAVLNLETGQVADLPDTWRFADPAAEPAWLPGDRLVTVKPGDWMGGSFPIQVYLWRLEANSPEMLQLEETFPVPGIDPNYIPFSPIQLDSGRVQFAVLPDDDVSKWSNYQWEGGLYSIRPGDPQPVKLNALPLELRQDLIRSMIWTPDGSGLFMEMWSDPGRKFLYLPTDNGPLYDLTPLIGESACCFEWLP